MIINTYIKALGLAGMFTYSAMVSSHAMDKDMSAFLGDAAKGEMIFTKCSGCHQVGDGAKNGVGPALADVYGRTTGTFAGYKYGNGLIAAGESGHVWDAEKIFNYLGDPKKYIRGVTENKKATVKMGFKLRNEDERKDVIAYLKSLSES